ncbi:hypothetical protein [Nocardia inohanensis]|uniref:hypothetical protein n=1 Tax=Nocardia inohanensis TaxID=209246 RepID=UPI0008302897|nr:hypothetical protein [Nocardia inohanensis]
MSPPDNAGATAVTAALIALILGPLTAITGIMWVLYMIVGADEHAREYSDEVSLYTDLFFMGIIAIVVGVAWYVGGFLLLAYLRTGRVVLILTSGVALIAGVAQFLNRGFVFLFIPVTASLLILVLSALPATGRWIAAQEPEPNPIAHEHDRG